MTDQKSVYKDTIRLPVTDFPMKANLPEREPQMIAKWQSQKIYQKMVAKNKGKPGFVFPDGPPYANAEIHIGHTLNKCLKDFITKYRNMRGYYTPYVPGWDCHGLPIEQVVNKNLGPKRKEKSNTDIRALCREEALKWVNRQREQFMRLGILSDWENPYMTMDKTYEAEEVRELARCLDRGVLFRGEKPVYWCPTLQTALAEAEVEYQMHKSPSIYVRFPFSKGIEKFGKFSKPVSVVIWTTTPWTLPANLGVAFNAKIDYEFFETDSEFLLFAKDLKESVEKETGLALQSTGRVYKGNEFERMNVQHPFYDRESLVVLGDHVGLEATGVVHTAPGHGQDDYEVGLKYGLKVYSPVDMEGRYTDDVPEYKGVKIFDANPMVVDRLRENGRLIAFKTIEHSYPHNWRSKTPLIFRATPQWFMSMDNPKWPVRKMALDALKAVEFVPAWGRNRIQSMIENRPDWVLSRQRVWGVPIPVFYCENCSEPLVDSKIFNRVADTMENEDGIEAYYRHAPSDFTQDAGCQKCGGKNFRHSSDILDVWFDSGVCHAAVQAKREGLKDVADIYLEGSDQHRGWFQTSLLTSIASKGYAPYKGLITHGFVMDDKGRKMSKSLGNVVEPVAVAKQSGAEILRLWSAYEDYGDDLSCGPESFARVTETYRRFRNTFRFLLGNISDFEVAKDRVDCKDLTVLDKWALHKLHELLTKITAAYDSYEFFKVYHALNHFFTVELSAGYLDMLKDRLYTSKADGVSRRSAQTVLYDLTLSLVQAMAPITTFLSEEVFSYFPGAKPESVLLCDFPLAKKEWHAPELAAEFETLSSWREDVTKSLEELRREKIIGSGLDAKVSLHAEGKDLELLRKYESLLPEFFIVSQISLAQGSKLVKTVKADGEKCERCWYYSIEIGKSQKHPTLCGKCVRALE